MKSEKRQIATSGFAINAITLPEHDSAVPNSICTFPRQQMRICCFSFGLWLFFYIKTHGFLIRNPCVFLFTAADAAVHPIQPFHPGRYNPGSRRLHRNFLPGIRREALLPGRIGSGPFAEDGLPYIAALIFSIL